MSACVSACVMESCVKGLRAFSRTPSKVVVASYLTRLDALVQVRISPGGFCA